MNDKKVQFRTYLSHADIAELEKLGETAGKLTGNSFASIVLSEIARLGKRNPNSGDIWSALARIADEAETAAPRPEPLPSHQPRLETRRNPRKRAAIVLPAEPAHAEG